MMNTIENILQEAKDQRWPYPKTFEALKKTGVDAYSVRFARGPFDATYQGTFGTWQESPPQGYQTLETANHFSQEGIKNAIIKHMQEKNSYLNFLTEIAAQGASHYTVDITKRTVTYFNPDETQFHEENVPHWKE